MLFECAYESSFHNTCAGPINVVRASFDVSLDAQNCVDALCHRAYGESASTAHVDSLCHLKRDVDPNNVLGEYFPLCPPSTSPLTMWHDGVIAS
jgi:flagellar basal body rod protein FlgF